jgi:hypothetical protein
MDDDATDADLNWRKAVVVASPGCKCGQVDVVKSHLSLQPCKLRDSEAKRSGTQPSSGALGPEDWTREISKGSSGEGNLDRTDFNITFSVSPLAASANHLDFLDGRC